MIKRHTAALQILPGKTGEFRTALGQIWPDLCAFLDEKGVRNFSIWNAENLVFFYGETTEEGRDKNVESEDPEKGKAAEKTTVNDETEALSRLMDILAPFEPCTTWLSAPGKGMRLMYHDFGIVRENKELIRHRMFMTRLKPGCAEEYKRRHDALVAARGGVPDPGPDSNFSIWSDGQHIFGYDEIDVTMETAASEEEKASTLAWETRQLEIMDWITNDCDALFGTHHAASVKLAAHN